MLAAWMAIAIICAVLIGAFYLTLRQKGLDQMSRWAWWKDYRERMRRYPTSQEVDDWISEQVDSPGILASKLNAEGGPSYALRG